MLDSNEYMYVKQQFPVVFQQEPVCFKNPFLKTQAKLFAKILHKYSLDQRLYGGSIYKTSPSDLDFFIPNCSTEEMDSLFRYLKYQKSASNATPPLPSDLDRVLVSAFTDLFSRKNIRLVDVYKKLIRNVNPSIPAKKNEPQNTTHPIEVNHDAQTVARHVVKITINDFPVDIILSPGSHDEHANEVDFALGGACYDVMKGCLYLYNQQSVLDWTRGELNYLNPDKIKEDPTILLRTVRALPTSAIPLSPNSQQLIHDHLSQNKSVFWAVSPDRLYHDIKLSFFSGHAVVNLQNLRYFQLFDQLFGYTIPPSESDLKLQQYLIDQIAILIDKNPSAYHPSLWYYAVHWTKIKNIAYQDPIFRHLSSYSQPTISIPLEALEKPTTESQNQTNTALTANIDEITSIESRHQGNPERIEEKCLKQAKIEAQSATRSERVTESPKPKKKRNYSPDEVLTAIIDQFQRELLSKLEEKYQLIKNEPKRVTYADALKTKPVPVINIEVIYNRPGFSDTESQSDDRKDSHHHFELPKKNKRLHKKSTITPFIIEKDISYESLCQRGNYFLSPGHEDLLDAFYYFQYAQKMHPERAEAYIGLGKVAHIEAEKMKNTVELFRTKFQKMSERQRNTPTLMSQTQYWQKCYQHQHNMMMGQYAKARSSFEHAIAINTVHQEILSKPLENILQAIEEHKNAHEKSSTIRKKTKKAKKNAQQQITPNNMNVDFNLTTTENVASQPIMQKTSHHSKIANLLKAYNNDLTSAVAEQKQNNFSAAKEHYQNFTQKNEKINRQKPSYTFYFSLAEIIHSKIYQGEPNYPLSEQKKSEQTALLRFLIDCYSKAIYCLSTKDFYDAHIRIAEIHFDLNNYQTVIDTLRPILDSSPQKCKHRYAKETLAMRIAESYEKIQAYEEAEKYYLIVLQEAKSKQLDTSAIELAISDLKKRQQAIKKIKDIKEQKAALAVKTAEKYKEEEQYEKAIETYQYIIKLDNKHLLAYRELASTYSAMSNYTDAIYWCNFLVNIDETQYNRDYLPVQKECAINYKAHQFLSLYNRGNIYLKSAGLTPSAPHHRQEVNKGMSDLQVAAQAYEQSTDPEFKETFCELMGYCYLTLGQHAQMTARHYREDINEIALKIGYKSDTTALINQIITTSIADPTLQKNNTRNLYRTQSKAIGIIMSPQVSDFFAKLPSSEYQKIATIINQILILENNAFVWLNIAADLHPTPYAAYCHLGILEKSRGKIDQAKEFYLSASKKIDLQPLESSCKYEHFNNLVSWVSYQESPLTFIRILSGVTEEETTQKSALLAGKTRDWIEFSKQFYLKAIMNSPETPKTPNVFMFAIIDYIQKNYISALLTFNNIINYKQFNETESIERELYFYCGQIYQALGRYENAKNYYKKVCKQEPYASDDANLTDRLRTLGQGALRITAQQYQAIVLNETNAAIEKALVSTQGIFGKTVTESAREPNVAQSESSNGLQF